MFALVFVLNALVFSACGEALVRPLNLADLHEHEGGLVGSIKVYHLGSDITERCSLLLANGQQRRDGRMSGLGTLRLPGDGWVFASVSAGPVVIWSVDCFLPPGYTLGIPLRLGRTVVERGRLAYFGHLQLEDRGEGLTFFDIAVRTPPTRSPGSQWIEDRFANAVREYRLRYGVRGRVLKMEDSVLSATVSESTKETQSVTPEQKQITTEFDLSGLKVAWLDFAKSDTQAVQFRIRHFARKPELDACHEVELAIDQEKRRYPVEYSLADGTLPFQEIVSGLTEIDTLKTVVAASHVELNVCGMRRTMSIAALDATRAFLIRLERARPRAAESQPRK